MQAWKRYKARPDTSVAQRDKTNRDFCIYHAAHGDYTYSDASVTFVVDKISTDAGFAEIQGTNV